MPNFSSFFRAVAVAAGILTTGAQAAGTVVDVVTGRDDLTTLVSLVKKAGLARPLAELDAVTLFAPTNEAFNAVPKDILSYLLSNNTALTNVLEYHVVESEILSSQIPSGETPVATLEGQKVVADKNSTGVFINEAQVTIPDLKATRQAGVVHVIDGVLVPPGLRLPSA